MIVKAPCSSTSQPISFKPVRGHPLMSACSKPGPNEAQLGSAHQPQCLLASPAANSPTEWLPSESNFHVSVSCLLNVSTIGAGEISYTHRWKPFGDEFGSRSGVPHAWATPWPLLRSAESMVLEPLPKMPWSPGPGSHGRWCFPMQFPS